MDAFEKWFYGLTQVSKTRSLYWDKHHNQGKTGVRWTNRMFFVTLGGLGLEIFVGAGEKCYYGLSQVSKIRSLSRNEPHNQGKTGVRWTHML